MLENCKGKKYCFAILGLIIGVFLVVLTIGKIIDIKNKVQITGNTITFSGTGDIYAKPDLVITSFSVITQAKTVAEALSGNTKRMNAVIDFMKGQGIAEKELKTTNFNIFPRYEWQDKGSRQVLVGYEVNQSLEVKIRDLAKVGQILQGGADAGANQVGNLSFTIDKEDELKSQARKLAIDQAKSKAKELADQLGIKLVKIVSFSEGGYRDYTPISFGLEKAAAPQIQTGENKIEVTVSITYEIR